MNLSDTLLESTSYTAQQEPLRGLARLVRCGTPWQASLAKREVSELLDIPNIHTILDTRTLDSLQLLNAENPHGPEQHRAYATHDLWSAPPDDLFAYVEGSQAAAGPAPRQSGAHALPTALGRGDARDRVLRLRAWLEANPRALSADTFKTVLRNIESASYQVTAVQAMVPNLPAISATDAAAALKSIAKDTNRLQALEFLEPKLPPLSAGDVRSILRAMDSDAFRVDALDILALNLGALSVRDEASILGCFCLESYRFDARLVLGDARWFR